LIYFRRKTGRTTNHNNDHGSSTTESSSTFEDTHQNSPKALLIPTENSPSSSNKKFNRYAESLKQSINDDNSSVTILRKKIDTKNSVYIPSTTSNILVDNSPVQVETTVTDDISVPNSHKLSSKEVRRRSVSLEDLFILKMIEINRSLLFEQFHDQFIRCDVSYPPLVSIHIYYTCVHRAYNFLISLLC